MILEEEEELRQSYRLTAQEILLSLPGIDVNNCNIVMSAVRNLAELSKLSEKQLEKYIGAANAKKLYSFFRSSSSSSSAASSGGGNSS